MACCDFEDTGESKPLIFYDKTVDLNGDLPSKIKIRQ